MKPTVIVFEGADGAGKSTLTEHVAQGLRNIGHKCRIASFPGKVPGSIGELVYRIHHDPKKEGIDKISSTSLQALHIAAHIDFLERIRIEPKSLLLLDRFWWSTIVYGQVAKANKEVIATLVSAEKILWKKYRVIVVLVSGNSQANYPTTNKLVREYKRLARLEKSSQPIVHHLNLAPVEDSARILLKSLLPHII
jgi:thymidylate kinase